MRVDAPVRAVLIVAFLIFMLFGAVASITYGWTIG